jgi:hypothetical protein
MTKALLADAGKQMRDLPDVLGAVPAGDERESCARCEAH